MKGVECLDAISGRLRPYDHPYYFYLAPGQGVLLKLNQ
jgi:hypothetical protein